MQKQGNFIIRRTRIGDNPKTVQAAGLHVPEIKLAQRGGVSERAAWGDAGCDRRLLWDQPEKRLRRLQADV